MGKLLKAVVRIVHEHVNPEEAAELQGWRDSAAEYKRVEQGRMVGPRAVPKITVLDGSINFSVIDRYICIPLEQAPQLLDLQIKERMEFMDRLGDMAKSFLPGGSAREKVSEAESPPPQSRPQPPDGLLRRLRNSARTLIWRAFPLHVKASAAASYPLDRRRDG